MRGQVEKVDDFFVLCLCVLQDGDRADLILPGNYPAAETFLPGTFRIEDGVACFWSDEGARYNPAGRVFERPGPADRLRPEGGFREGAFGRI